MFLAYVDGEFQLPISVTTFVVLIFAFIMLIVLMIFILPKYFLTPIVKDDIKADPTYPYDRDSFILRHNANKAFDTVKYFLYKKRSKLIFFVKENVHYVEADILCLPYNKEAKRSVKHIRIYTDDLDNERKLEMLLPPGTDDVAIYVNRVNDEPRMGWDLSYLPKASLFYYSLLTSLVFALSVVLAVYTLSLFIYDETVSLKAFYLLALLAVPLFFLLKKVTYYYGAKYVFGGYVND